MYKYDTLDQTLVNERVAQYEGQLTRFLNKELTEEEFRPLRLQNGLDNHSIGRCPVYVRRNKTFGDY